MRCVVWYEKGGLRGTGQSVEMLTGCLMPGKSRALEMGGLGINPGSTDSWECLGSHLKFSSLPLPCLWNSSYSHLTGVLWGLNRVYSESQIQHRLSWQHQRYYLEVNPLLSQPPLQKNKCLHIIYILDLLPAAHAAVKTKRPGSSRELLRCSETLWKSPSVRNSTEALSVARSCRAQDEAPAFCSTAAETRSALLRLPTRRRQGRMQTASPGSTVESGVSTDLLKLALQIKEIHILLSTFMSVWSTFKMFTQV